MSFNINIKLQSYSPSLTEQIEIHNLGYSQKQIYKLELQKKLIHYLFDSQILDAEQLIECKITLMKKIIKHLEEKNNIVLNWVIPS